MVKVWKIIVHIVPSTVTARASVYENEKLVTRFSDKTISESMNQRTSHIYHEWEWVGRGKVVAFILSQKNPYQYVHEDFRSVRRPCANKCKETCKSYAPFTFALTRLLLPYEKVWASRRRALIRPQVGIRMCVGSSFRPLKLLPKNGIIGKCPFAPSLGKLYLIAEVHFTDTRAVPCQHYSYCLVFSTLSRGTRTRAFDYKR